MPTASQDKKLLKIIMKLQDKVENLAGIGSDGDHINSFAFNELSKLNAVIFEELKMLFTVISDIKNTSWYLNITNDPSYHRRQVLTRKEKIGADGYALCECGDWVSQRVPKYFEEHRKRNKCVSNMFRIAYDTSNWKLKKRYKLDTLLVLNGHISELKNSGVPTSSGAYGGGMRYSPYGMYCLGQLIRRRQVALM
jgi:hypothetical protein